MRIYEFKTSLVTAAGSTSTVTLSIIGGLLRNVFVQANTATTVFRFNLQDEDTNKRLDFGFHTGTLNENALAFPIVNKYTVNITNASPNDTFVIRLGVQE